MSFAAVDCGAEPTTGEPYVKVVFGNLIDVIPVSTTGCQASGCLHDSRHSAVDRLIQRLRYIQQCSVCAERGSFLHVAAHNIRDGSDAELP